MASEIYDCIIVGAGPAGMTAGIYAARAGLRALILERSFAGGQMTKTDLIENYPAFPNGITGFDLAEQMQKQTKKFGVEIGTASVGSIEVERDAVQVPAGSQVLAGRALIVATGSEPKPLGVPGEQRLFGRGVSTCAVCDGALFRGKAVAVIGGGDSALGEALYLSRICAKVYLVHRREAFRGAKVLQNRVRVTPGIEVVWNGLVQEVQGEGRVEALRVKDKLTGGERSLEVSAVFVYVGAVPNTQFLRGLVTLDADGYVVTDAEMRTNEPRILACGDCRSKSLRQVSTAVGDGAVAATSVERMLTLG